MCIAVYLLANRPLPVSLDEDAYPGLKLHLVQAEYAAQTLAEIRRAAPAAYVYDVSPAGYCGCYFGYETPQEFQAEMEERAANPDARYANTPEQAETMWRGRRDAVNSFGRYLAAHLEAQLAVYAVWEGCAGQKVPVRAQVPPSYFGGPGFVRLPENVLLTVMPEATLGRIPQWDPAARRTHEWLSSGSDRGQSPPDALAEETQPNENEPN